MKAQHDGLLWAAVLLTWLVGTGCNDSKASAASASTALADPVGSCGKKGLPDCPLQEWMKANLQADVSSGDTTRLATALDELATKAPAGYGNWKGEAESAARAARAGNMAAVKVACKQCHDEHRSKFRAEMRTARLF